MTEPVRANYSVMLPLVCGAHFEHGAIPLCPHPGCSQGLSLEQDRVIATPPVGEDTTFVRTPWNIGGGEQTWSWEEPDRLPLYLSAQRVFWREAYRLNLIKMLEPHEVGDQRLDQAVVRLRVSGVRAGHKLKDSATGQAL